MKALCAIVMTIAVLAFAGCGAKKEGLPATHSIPVFADTSVNEYAQKYADTANAYVNAYKTQNLNQAVTLTVVLAGADATLPNQVAKLNADEAKKLKDWTSTLTKQMNDTVEEIKSKM